MTSRSLPHYLSSTILIMLGLSVCLKSWGNWDIDGLNGGLRVDATLVESPCQLSVESAEQQIDLGTMKSWNLMKPGDLGQPVPLHLILENCMASERVIRSAEHGNNITDGHTQPLVVISLDGDESSESTGLWRLTGTAKGIGLRLEDSDGHMFHPGEAGWPQFLEPGRNDFIVNARLSRTTESLIPGEYIAVVNLGLEYM